MAQDDQEAPRVPPPEDLFIDGLCQLVDGLDKADPASRDRIRRFTDRLRGLADSIEAQMDRIEGALKMRRDHLTRPRPIRSEAVRNELGRDTWTRQEELEWRQKKLAARLEAGGRQTLDREPTPEEVAEAERALAKQLAGIRAALKGDDQTPAADDPDRAQRREERARKRAEARARLDEKRRLASRRRYERLTRLAAMSPDERAAHQLAELDRLERMLGSKLSDKQRASFIEKQTSHVEAVARRAARHGSTDRRDWKTDPIEDEEAEVRREQEAARERAQEYLDEFGGHEWWDYDGYLTD